MAETTFLVFDPEYPLRSSLEIPKGRDTYINFSLEHERQNPSNDGFTLEENKKLYGIQFDEAQAHRHLEEGVISTEVFQLVQEGANSIKREINAARHKRRQLEKDDLEPDTK